MSRWTAVSDLDYEAEYSPRARHEQCATPNCCGIVARASHYIYCVRCLADATMAESRRQAKANNAKKSEVA